jgi:hypothetical protein
MAWNRYEDERRPRGYGDPDTDRYGRSESRDRGRLERGADEMRSWFGDEEAEQRRRREVPIREGRDFPDDRASRGGTQFRGSGDYGYSGTRPAQQGSRSEWRDIGGDDDNEFENNRGASSRRSGGGYQPTTWSYTEMWLIPGPFVGQGPRGYQRSDERIKEDVCERLAQHGMIDARNIDVTVENGEVTLRGSVDSRHTKRIAEDAVESISGVRDVRNELRAGMQESTIGEQSGTAQSGRQTKGRATT